MVVVWWINCPKKRACGFINVIIIVSQMFSTNSSCIDCKNGDKIIQKLSQISKIGYYLSCVCVRAILTILTQYTHTHTRARTLSQICTAHVYIFMRSISVLNVILWLWASERAARHDSRFGIQMHFVVQCVLFLNCRY